MKTRCVIVDDEPIAIRVIKNHLQHFADIEIVAECSNAIQAFEFIKKNKVDLMFLDIQMPQVSGLDFLKLVNNPPKVIITTAYRDYAVESYEYDVVDYLMKPIPLDRIVKALNKYYTLVSRENIGEKTVQNLTEDKILHLKENKTIHNIACNDILYLESEREYVKIFALDRKIVVKATLSSFGEILPASEFIRIHKSFIVSKSKIKSFSHVMVEVPGQKLPISRNFKARAIELLSTRENLL